jgi:signal transduction histidine kinase
MQNHVLREHDDAKFHILAEVSRQISSILDIDQLLVQVVRLIRERFDYYHVGIGLIEGDEIYYRVGAGSLWEKNPEFQFKPQRIKVGMEGLTGWVAGTGEPVLVPDVSKDPRYLLMEGCQTRSELIVPIIIREQIIGVLDAQSEHVDDFTERDLELMQALASQAGVAIQNARLYEQARQVAVMEERQRLSRELHDSVTQALYGISLYAEAASGHFARKQLDKVQQYLTDIKNTAQESLADMRLMIFELRHPLLEKEGLVPVLQARLYSVEKRAGHNATLESALDQRLPSAIEVGLYRIANEALNNALKHAHARNVTVRLMQEGSSVTLEIADDGIGFLPSAAGGQGRLGLTTMRERALAEGWDLSIDSAPGKGTSIRIVAEVK